MLKKFLNSAMLMTWAGDFVRLVSPFIIVPLVIRFYSNEEQTFYFMLQIIYSFALVADAGISSVIVRATSYFKAGADKVPKNREEFDNADKFENRPPNMAMVSDLFNTSRRIYFILTAIFIVLLSTAGVSIFWNVMRMTGHRPDMWGAYAILVVYFGLYMVNMRWSSFMRGLDFVAQEARYNILATAFRIVLWIIALSFKMKPIALTTALLFEGVFMYFFRRYFINRWFASMKVNPYKEGKFNLTLFKTLWPAAWRQGGIQLGNFMVERGNNLIILQVHDAALMANFTFTTWILKTIFGISLTPVYSRLPVLYKHAAEKNFGELKRSAAGYMFIGLFIICFAYALLGAFGNTILEHTGDERRFIYPLVLFIVMAITEVLDLHSSFHAGVYTSTNHIPFLWPSLIAGMAIYFVGRFYALAAFGVAGIIFTRFLVQICFNNWYAMYLNLKFLKWPFFKFLLDVPRYGVLFLKEKIVHFSPAFLKR